MTEFTFNGLKTAILKNFEGYYPKWWNCNSRKFRKEMKDKPILRIHRIVFSNLKFFDSLFGDSIDSDGKVSEFKKGEKLDVIFV